MSGVATLADGSTTEPIGLPAEFDAEYYCSRYPELGLTTYEEAEPHFRKFGADAGLEGSPLVHRSAFLDDMFRREGHGDALEIGPGCNPVLSGPHVAYLDAFDAAELRLHAQQQGQDPERCPDEIHFVGGLEDVDRQFDYVFGSHSIEHQPDLVQHLKFVSNILKGGGRYYLIIPDKRYCFDARKAESTIAGVLQAHKERRSRHNLQTVIEGTVLTTHNDAVRHWKEVPNSVEETGVTDRVKYALKVFTNAAGNYIDLHAWYFTPETFRSITATLFELGYTALKPACIFNTPRNSLEFCAILTKQSMQEQDSVLGGS